MTGNRLIEGLTASVTNRENINLYSVIALEASGIALATEKNHKLVSTLAGGIAAAAAGVVVAEGFLRDQEIPFLSSKHDNCPQLFPPGSDGAW